MSTKATRMSAAELNNRCLRVMDQVHASGGEMIITKRGRPVVRIVAAREAQTDDALQGLIVHQDDDLTTTGEPWQAER